MRSTNWIRETCLDGNRPIDSTEYLGVAELQALERNMSAWLERKAELISSVIAGRDILEVGCGIGSLTRRLSSQGLNVVALDSSELCLKYACRKRAPNVVYLLDDIRRPIHLASYKNSFDTVLMSDVLEHIDDENAALTNAGQLLRRRGVLVITVPAFGFLFSEQDRKIGHLRRYTKRRLVKRLAEAGFGADYCRYWNLPGLIGWLIYCKLMKRSVSTISSALGMRLYGSWLRLESLARLPVGLTLVVRARRRAKLATGTPT